MKWTDEEKEYVERNHLTMSDLEIARKLNRSKASVYSFRRKHGMTHPYRNRASDFNIFNRILDNQRKAGFLEASK